MTASGIVLPETAKEKPQRGNILATGPGTRDDDGKRVPLDVTVGDVVLYAKYAGTEFKVDGKKLLILKESDLLAIVEAGDEAVPDDRVERWLGVPLDFTAHLLANEMHDQLMDTYSGRKRRNRR